MKMYIIGILLFLFLVFIIWIVDLEGRPDIYIDEIRKGYKGVIVDKFLKRTIILKIKTDNGEVMEVGILCNKLKDISEVGDRIKKIPNENYVFLEKDSSVLKLPYIYISKKVRTDRRWPKEWKDKWLESTY